MYKNKDKRAKLDGNAILLSEGSNIKQSMIVDQKVLHISGTRNCHLIKIDPHAEEDGPMETPKKFIYFVNTHMHDP